MLADAPGAVARELLAQDGARVVAALAAPDDQNEGIHAARKAIRRMRAVLALLDEDEFELEREDRSLRRLGKSLSALRDAHVVVEAAKRLQVEHPEPGWDTIITALEMRRTRILQRSLAQDPGFARRRRVVTQLQSWIACQPWQNLRRATIRDGLARSERRVKRAAARAAHDGSPDQMHQWRRRVRRLRMQLDAVDALGGQGGHGRSHDGSARKAKALHKTSDLLGWNQDLRLLRNLVRNLPPDVGKTEVMVRIERALEAAGDHLPG